MTRNRQVGFVSQAHTGDISWRESIGQAVEFGFDFVELYMDGAAERTNLDAAYQGLSKRKLGGWWAAVRPPES
ncbi:hypothetical protein [Haloarcula onubensis]|uniref:Sugar phosphate isomerase/epimerase n=1 Tax=Haloarcula onubensis TaxID=2950539 RepID=A0ABU2FS23_9EURY|nr:hypothetical protein [Halomicroarcula sp. S3CR25-11]MDS0283046.1 hypothetical protein [Halomicroarcula sp. S3CR25-11]